MVCIYLYFLLVLTLCFINNQPSDLQTAIFQTVRVLSRSRTGINHLMTEKVPLHIILAHCNRDNENGHN